MTNPPFESLRKFPEVRLKNILAENIPCLSRVF